MTWTVPADDIVPATGKLDNPSSVLTSTQRKRLKKAETAKRPVFVVTEEEALENEKDKQHFKKPPVICLSVSDNKTYQQTENLHPILGVEYQPNESSLTEQYFKKMGLQVRYFMPPNSVAPLAFYFFGRSEEHTSELQSR